VVDVSAYAAGAGAVRHLPSVSREVVNNIKEGVVGAEVMQVVEG